MIIQLAISVCMCCVIVTKRLRLTGLTPKVGYSSKIGHPPFADQFSEVASTSAGNAEQI